MRFLALLCLLAAPASAAEIKFAEGDVICVRHNPADQTCLTKGTFISAGEGRVSYTEETLFSEYDPDLALTSFSQLTRQGSRLCLVPGTIRAVVFPEMSAPAQILSMSLTASSERLARQGYCVEHRRCGTHFLSLAWRGGLRDPSGDSSFTLFRAGDPVIKRLSVRPATFADLADQVESGALKCQSTS